MITKAKGILTSELLLALNDPDRFPAINDLRAIHRLDLGLSSPYLARKINDDKIKKLERLDEDLD